MSPLILLLIAFLSPQSHGHVAYINSLTTPVDMNGTSISYAADYVSARASFRKKASDVKSKYSGSEVGQYKIPSKKDPDLTTDYIFIPGKGKKLFVLTSGMHGPEGYTGHAHQILFMDQLLANKETLPYSILIVHALNPFGYKYFTRTNENNVDLNRNFITSHEDFKLVNKEYEKLKPLLEPPIPASGYFLARVGFYSQIGWVNLRRGRKTVLGSLRGQYQNPRGIFYGGQEVQPETKSAQSLIKRFAANANEIYLADLHTGFGEKGHLHFFGSDEIADPQDKERQAKLFEGYSIDSGHDKNFYSTTGDFNDWVRTAFPKKRVIAMTYEFGTLDSQTLRGSLRSLWIMVLENQGRHQGYFSQDDEKKSLLEYELLFNPQNLDWRRSVLTQGSEALTTTLKRFSGELQ